MLMPCVPIGQLLSRPKKSLRGNEKAAVEEMRAFVPEQFAYFASLEFSGNQVGHTANRDLVKGSKGHHQGF
jgi:hypothetical protein